MARTPATATTQIDNGVMRVTRWDFVPGSETGQHRHGYDYVVVPLTEGPLTIEADDGPPVTASLEPGASYDRPAGVEHNVVNLTDHPISFVEIELLDRPG